MAEAKRRRDWTPAFLHALAETGIVRSAAAAAGIAANTAYTRRKADPKFAAAWDEVIETAMQELERAVYKRATEGSDLLAMFLLKAHRPDKYRDNARIEHAGDTKSPVWLQIIGEK